MRCQTIQCPFRGEASNDPSRVCANHHFSGGYDFTSGLFAYGHFQLRNIDPDFCFAFWAVQWEIKYHCILTYFGSGLTAANRTVNPLGSVQFVIHVSFLHIVGLIKLFCIYKPIMCLCKRFLDLSCYQLAP